MERFLERKQKFHVLFTISAEKSETAFLKTSKKKAKPGRVGWLPRDLRRILDVHYIVWSEKKKQYYFDCLGFPIQKLQSRVLHLHVFDYDRFSRDDSIGEVFVPLCQVLHQKPSKTQ